MRTTVAVIGAGHAGLAMSRRLTEHSIDHVVLERGQVANSWHTERWASLRLLTPNWQTTLPGQEYRGADRDGFMTVSDVAAFIDTYARTIDAPVQADTTVTGLRTHRDGYELVTDRGPWVCDAVVIASGHCNRAHLPPVAAEVPATITVHTPMTYRSPDQLAEGGVLVVGSSATGVQLADEIHRSGRAVTISVGEHVRVPRTYRGRDVFWWMDATGVLDERHDTLDDLQRARHVPSPQLIGSADHRSVDLNALARRGIAVVGRLGRVVDGTAQFSGSLANLCTLADLKMNRLLDMFDEWARATRADGGLDAPERFEPTCLPPPPLTIDLQRAGITTVLFATGYRPDYSWLELPVTDRRGHLRHDGGVVADAPGLYAVGLPVLRRRRSTYLNGAAADSADIAVMLHRHLDLVA